MRQRLEQTSSDMLLPCSNLMRVGLWEMPSSSVATRKRRLRLAASKARILLIGVRAQRDMDMGSLKIFQEDLTFPYRAKELALSAMVAPKDDDWR